MCVCVCVYNLIVCVFLYLFTREHLLILLPYLVLVHVFERLLKRNVVYHCWYETLFSCKGIYVVYSQEHARTNTKQYNTSFIPCSLRARHFPVTCLPLMGDLSQSGLLQDSYSSDEFIISATAAPREKRTALPSPPSCLRLSLCPPDPSQHAS